MNNEQWSMVNGQWSMVNGQWILTAQVKKYSIFTIHHSLFTTTSRSSRYPKPFLFLFLAYVQEIC
jgi:hypothetical protein